MPEDCFDRGRKSASHVGDELLSGNRFSLFIPLQHQPFFLLAIFWSISFLDLSLLFPSFAHHGYFSTMGLSRHPWALLPAQCKLVHCIPENGLQPWLWCLFYPGLIINHVRALVMLLQNCFGKPAQQNVLKILLEDKAFKEHTRNKKTSVQHTDRVSQKSGMDRDELSLREVQKLKCAFDVSAWTCSTVISSSLIAENYKFSLSRQCSLTLRSAGYQWFILVLISPHSRLYIEALHLDKKLNHWK